MCRHANAFFHFAWQQQQRTRLKSLSPAASQARTEPMRLIEIARDSKLRPITVNYTMVFKHPLPIGGKESRLENDVAFRAINHLPADRRCWRAITVDRPWCLEELYLQGFPLMTPNGDGLTPLHLACHLGHSQCVQVLVNAGVDVNAETIAGVTPLCSAIAAGNHHLLPTLVQAGAVKRKLKKLSGHRTILDVAADRMGRSVQHDLAAEHKRPPYFCEF